MVIDKILQINKVVNVIKNNVTRLKISGCTQEEVRSMVYNICYIKNCIAQTLNLCLVDDNDYRINRIANAVDKEINKQFHTKYNTDEYVDLKNVTHRIDIPHTKRQYGNTWETQFEDLDALSGKNFQTDYETVNGESCNLEQEFTEDGTLISKCKRNPNEEEK